MIPEIERHGELTSVKIGKITVWFSFDTPVACDSPDYGLVVSENVWSATTGKHLKMIDNGESRVSNDRFVEILDEVCR